MGYLLALFIALAGFLYGQCPATNAHVCAAAENGAEDQVLTMSQLFLFGSGAAKSVTHYTANVNETGSSAVASIGLVAFSVTTERIFQRRMSKRMKIFVGITNAVGGAILTGFAISHARDARTRGRGLR